MRRIHLLAVCLLANLAYAQTANYAKAPNSYIYDLEQAHAQNYGGITIPVAKAYQMWSQYEYLKTNGQPTPIPAGNQSASLYWEDVPGLVQNVSIEPAGDASQSKIKVAINKGRGKGNAVVAFKVDGVIYWSWHIWVTDNPENGVTYGHGTETDADGNLVSIQYMDRNLGAVSGSFLDHDWQKSGGLMYEWGRKDPFPPLVYKDSGYYAISGEVGTLRHPQIDPNSTIPVEVRPYNEIEKNIQYSVNNPITYIINTDSGGNWFSSSRYKVPGVSPLYQTWDLWSDNANGGNSNGNSSNATLRNESLSYELKSELDPCPSGWRIPSYYGRETQNNNLSFFGKKGDWNNADTNIANRQLFPESVNPHLNGVKVYPGLGMDFTDALAGNRNIGILPVPGAYVYYPNSVSPNAPVGVMFQDNSANGGLWSSTFAYDGARIFSMISDPLRNSTSVGLHAIYNNQTNPTRSGNAVRCIKDPNLAKIGHFATEYFASEKENYTEGLNNPNSYIVKNQSVLNIPVSKAFAVHNQLLSDQEILPHGNLMAQVQWTSNKNLIKSVRVVLNPEDAKKSVISVTLDPNITGNAVVSLHDREVTNPVMWSWHIWATDEDPTANPITYVTEAPIPVSHNFVNPTASTLPSLKTVFMDRNLGALSGSLDSGNANGLHYQWGRKDPLPSFMSREAPTVFRPALPREAPLSPYIVRPQIIYEEIAADKFEAEYSDPYHVYGSSDQTLINKLQANIKYSIENPFRFLFRSGQGAVYDGGNHYSNNLTQVRDWVADERGTASDRWGHGGEKSPFDPCPEGWRVPDVSFTNLYTGSKGSSPWYNGYRVDAYGKQGVIQDQWHGVGNFYAGTTQGSEGWKFNDPSFYIGEYPNDGIRGELGDSKLNRGKAGVWTAAMADLNTGFALAMQFQGDKMQTATGAYPQAAMSVRCAKDEKRLLGTPAEKNTPPTTNSTYLKSNAAKPSVKEMNIYPNPFKDDFKIEIPSAKNYEIYDASGKLVLTGTLLNGNVNATSLPKGVYVVKVTMNDGTSVSKKLIKN